MGADAVFLGNKRKSNDLDQKYYGLCNCYESDVEDDNNYDKINRRMLFGIIPNYSDVDLMVRKKSDKLSISVLSFE